MLVMKEWLSELYRLARTYICVIKEAWMLRNNTQTIKRRQDEYDFMPAHLELIERPVSPAPRVVAFVIMFCLAMSLIIAIFFHVEIVAVSPGKLELTSRSKKIQPLETSLVKKVYVKDGDLVKEGDLLISLSAIGAASDKAKIESSLLQEKLSEKRQHILLVAIDKGELPEQSEHTDDYDYDSIRSEQLLREQFFSWKKTREQQLSAIRQRIAEKETIQFNIRKLESQKTIALEKMNDITKLYNSKAISKHEYLQHKNTYLELKSEVEIQKNRLNEVSESISQAREQYDLLLQTYKRDVVEELSKTKEKIKQLKYDLKKNSERESALNIRSPVNGIVQQVATFTEGGVVTTAQTLMVIVPEKDRLNAKIMISNKDIGFVRVGQPVIIKVEAFPYTRYGYIRGIVKNVSTESIEDKEKGLYFDGYISLEQSTLKVNGRDVSLTSGMSVTAEIITGYRRVIDFILSPLQETVNESLVER